MSTTDEREPLLYLHLSDNRPCEEDQIVLSDGQKVPVIWKDILVEGTYPMTPVNGQAVKQPLTITAEGESDVAKNVISMADLMHGHEDGAFKYVTVPTSHRDGLLDNTGYVPPKGLRVVERDGKKVMQAGLGFTEPDIKGKVQRGTIPDVSAGIFRNWLNKHTTKRYKAALKHVALTPTPFMGNLTPFAPVFASDDELDTKVEVLHYTFSDEATSGSTENNSSSSENVEIAWREEDGSRWLMNALNDALRPAETPPEDGRPYVPQPSYYVQDVSQAKKRALVEEFFKGNTTKFVVPFDITDDKPVPAPSMRWTEVRDAMIAASDEFVPSGDIAGKLTTYLSENFGAENFRVADVSLDRRARIENEHGNGAWLAPFTLFSDGSVALAPSHRWEVIETPQEKPKEETPERPVASTVQMSDVVSGDKPFSTRLQAARQRRKLIASA